MSGMKAAAAFLVLAMTASEASAEPCGDVPTGREMRDALGRAGEARPVNVTFRTQADGVEMPSYLLTQYPDEMTIILQYQFDRPSVSDDRFAVRVWFKGRAAQLLIPFASIMAVYVNSERKCFGP